MRLCSLATILLLLVTGCAATSKSDGDRSHRTGLHISADQSSVLPATQGTATKPAIQLVSGQQEDPDAATDPPSPPPSSSDSSPTQDPPQASLPIEETTPGATAPQDAGGERATSVSKVSLQSVIDSVHDSFPLVEAAYRETEIANGNVIAAQGGFDTKLKASSENGPTGFYQTYRQQTGVIQPLYNGGEVFGGYRIGRGDFEPWYRERQTDDGGGFKVGGSVPQLRNSEIDARRAALWRANYDTQIAQPAIRGQLIGFTLDASLAYWKWVAEGRKYFAERDWLALAEKRNSQVQIRFEKGDLGGAEVTDNARAIAKRKAKVVDQLRKVQQSAIKLSLFLRTADGSPIVPTLDQLPTFPKPGGVNPSQVVGDIETALTQRPDLEVLRLLQQRLRVDLEEAANMGLPKLDAYLVAGQDVGEPTSSKRDKSRFEVDLGVMFDVPIQRRKATGKMQAVQAKIAQVNAKERYTIDKISAGVRAAFTGIAQAFEQLQAAARARELAEEMAQIERDRFRLGDSDLLKVALREQDSLDAVEGEVSALLNYFAARSQYLAELGESQR